MLADFLLFSLGVVMLVMGAESLVTGASRIARRMNISPLVIGLTIIAFGTSLPETAVTVSAALDGRTDVAIGNVVGSNIFNVLLILGITAMIASLSVARQLIRQEVPIMIALSLLLFGLIVDNNLSRIESAVLLFLSVVYTVFLIVQARRSNGTMPATVAVADDIGTDEASGWLGRVPAVLLILVGLVLLGVGGRWLVDSAVSIAQSWGISELVIGLTVVAIGTSLPELATCVAAALRGERDMAVGNVVGSNIFNILFCLGAAGVIAPAGLNAPPALLTFDIWVMIAVALILLPVILTERKVSRWEGALLFGYGVAYIAWTLLTATQHPALPMFTQVMLLFVMPVSALILLISVVRSPISAARVEAATAYDRNKGTP